MLIGAVLIAVKVMSGQSASASASAAFAVRNSAGLMGLVAGCADYAARGPGR
ncbi:hypothetical protein ACIPWI_21405 [Streptomyces sp. NPDC090046]|uniref:hypothetical protein n=1 Tax=Streptomyces sp. NPDC090046 TaxID=3365928 RepID=UPI00380B3B43